MAELIADPMRAARLVLHLRQNGVMSGPVLKAIETIDRSAFAASDLRDLAFEDTYLPIACGQSILPPVTTAKLMQAMGFADGRPSRVLLVGAGSGYMAALIASLSDHVVAAERYITLVEAARDRLASASVRNVDVVHCDGLTGCPEFGPYDRIVLSGSVETVDPRLLSSLSRGGRIVAPIRHEDQVALHMIEADKRVEGDRLVRRLPPLQTGVAKRL